MQPIVAFLILVVVLAVACLVKAVCEARRFAREVRTLTGRDPDHITSRFRLSRKGTTLVGTPEGKADQ